MSAENHNQQAGGNDSNTDNFCPIGLFMKNGDSGNESDRQTDLAESLKKTYVGNVPHGKKNKSVSRRTANTGNNRIQRTFQKFFKTRPFLFAAADTEKFSPCHAEFNQKQISERIRNRDFT